MDLGRESIGMTQKEFVNLLNQEGIDCNISDISRCENGYIERLLYVGSKAVEIADRVSRQEKQFEPFKTACKRSKYEKQILHILRDGEKHTKQELMTALGIDCVRQIRKEIQLVKDFYPILQSPNEKGYALATDQRHLLAARRQVGELEGKKKIFSRQERPLIAFIYEQEKRGAVSGK